MHIYIYKNMYTYTYTYTYMPSPGTAVPLDVAASYPRHPSGDSPPRTESGAWLRVEGCGSVVSGWGLRVEGGGGSGSRVQGAGLRLWGVGCWVYVSGWNQALDCERPPHVGRPVSASVLPRRGLARAPPRKALRGGISKVNFQQTLSFFWR